MMKKTGFWGLLATFCGAGFVLTLTACDPPTEDDDKKEEKCYINGQEAQCCTIPRDCGAGYDCALGDNNTRACLKLGCIEDTDCNVEGGETCDRRRQVCVGCQPGLAGACPGGQVCLGGLCTTPPPPADACSVAPSSSVVRAGESIVFTAAGFMNSGALAPLAEFTWASDDTSCVTIDSASGSATGAGSATCTTNVVATPVGGTATCSASVTNFPTVDLPSLRVLVIEEFSNDPVENATVLVQTDDGAGGSTQTWPTVTTDATGIATLDLTGVTDLNNIQDVSVFEADHTYVTVVRPRTNDLLFYVRRMMPDNRMAGVKGTFDFSNVNTQGDIKLGISGFSIVGSITDLDFMMLLGEPVPRDINLEGVGNFEDVELPSGLFMEVGAAAIKGDFQAFGEPGNRILWGLGGKVRLGEVGPIISEVAGDSGDLELGSILASVLPYFGTFDHDIVGNLHIVEVDKPDSGEPNDWNFDPPAPQTLSIDTQLSQEAKFTLPTLPLEPGSTEWATGAIMLVGAFVPGQGVVPLGLTAGLDAPNDSDTADGKVDPSPCPDTQPNCVLPAKGELLSYFAPPHSGMEGSQYLTLAMALGLDSISAATATSMLVSISDNIGSSNSFPSGAFLEYPQNGTYVQGASYEQTTEVNGKDFYRLNMDTGGQDWQVYFDDAADGFQLPTPPAGFADRSENVDIQTFKTFTGSFSVKDLFEFNGTDLDDMLYLTAAFSSLECTPLEAPKTGNCDDDYTVDADTGLCIGGPNSVTAFTAGTANPCSADPDYQPSYVGAVGSSDGICAKTPPCLGM